MATEGSKINAPLTSKFQNSTPPIAGWILKSAPLTEIVVLEVTLNVALVAV